MAQLLKNNNSNKQIKSVSDEKMKEILDEQVYDKQFQKLFERCNILNTKMVLPDIYDVE